MVKFVLIMFICSSVPGNDCKLMSTPVVSLILIMNVLYTVTSILLNY